jgi:hypothetical protein
MYLTSQTRWSVRSYDLAVFDPRQCHSLVYSPSAWEMAAGDEPPGGGGRPRRFPFKPETGLSRNDLRRRLGERK